MDICVPCVCLVPVEAKEDTDSLEVELKMVVSDMLVLGTEPCPSKNSQCSHCQTISPVPG